MLGSAVAFVGLMLDIVSSKLVTFSKSRLPDERNYSFGSCVWLRGGLEVSIRGKPWYRGVNGDLEGKSDWEEDSVNEYLSMKVFVK